MSLCTVVCTCLYTFTSCQQVHIDDLSSVEESAVRLGWSQGLGKSDVVTLLDCF